MPVSSASSCAAMNVAVYHPDRTATRPRLTPWEERAASRGQGYYGSVGKVIRIGGVKRRAKVIDIDITERRREATDLVKFIDAHGGKLGAFRAYQVRPPASPPSEQRPPEREE
jgi:hypothetical protein